MLRFKILASAVPLVAAALFMMPMAALADQSSLCSPTTGTVSGLQLSTNYNNAINALKAVNAIPKGIMQNHYFTSATAWFIRSNVPRGMMWYDREEMTFDEIAEIIDKPMNTVKSWHRRALFKLRDRIKPELHH